VCALMNIVAADLFEKRLIHTALWKTDEKKRSASPKPGMLFHHLRRLLTPNNNPGFRSNSFTRAGGNFPRRQTSPNALPALSKQENYKPANGNDAAGLVLSEKSIRVVPSEESVGCQRVA